MLPTYTIAVFFYNYLLGISGKRTMAFFISVASYLTMQDAYVVALTDGVPNPADVAFWWALSCSFVLWASIWISDFIKSTR